MQLKSNSFDPTWVCCQIGAREHYAIPRGLISQNREVKLLTDVWSYPQTRWLMPRRWQQRLHSEISSQHVTSWNVSAFRLRAQSSTKRLSLWQRVLIEDEWFQQKASRWLKLHVPKMSQPPVVFAYSYAARKIFETAKELGCRTILGQIDPGPVEMRLVQSLEKKYGQTNTEWPPDRYWDCWKQECALADTIVVNSTWSQDAMLQEGVPAPKVQVIPLAYERSESEPNPTIDIPDSFSASRPLKVLFLGQVNLRKGIKELGDAISILEGQHVHWTVVGNGAEPLLTELRALPQTTVTGPVSRQDVANYYRDADVFILPTHSDGFALTQLEAASYGLPIIASRFCGEVVVHDENGITTSQVSGPAIADAVSRLIHNPALLRRMSEAQCQRPMLSINQLGRRFESLSETFVQSGN